MDNKLADTLLHVAMRCDAAMGKTDYMTDLARQIIEGKSSSAHIALLWRISDARNGENSGAYMEIQELQDALLRYRQAYNL